VVEEERLDGVADQAELRLEAECESASLACV